MRQVEGHVIGFLHVAAGRQLPLGALGDDAAVVPSHLLVLLRGHEIEGRDPSPITHRPRAQPEGRAVADYTVTVAEQSGTQHARRNAVADVPCAIGGSTLSGPIDGSSSSVSCSRSPPAHAARLR